MLLRFLGDLGTREATRDAIGAWLERHQSRPFLRIIGMLVSAGEYREGYEEGIEQARAWIKRRDGAREKGEPFDEPPPGTDENMN